MLITTSLHFEYILASPLVLMGIFDKYSEALKNLFRTRPTKTEEWAAKLLLLLEENILCWIKQSERGKAAAAVCPWIQTVARLKCIPNKCTNTQSIHIHHTYAYIYTHTYVCHTDHRQAHRVLAQTQAIPTVSSCFPLWLSRWEVH